MPFLIAASSFASLSFLPFFLNALIPPAIPLNQLPQIDFITVSHNHYDHLDIDSLKKISELNPDAVFLVPAGDLKLLKRKRIDNVYEFIRWHAVRNGKVGDPTKGEPAIFHTSIRCTTPGCDRFSSFRLSHCCGQCWNTRTLKHTPRCNELSHEPLYPGSKYVVMGPPPDDPS